MSRLSTALCFLIIAVYAGFADPLTNDRKPITNSLWLAGATIPASYAIGVTVTDAPYSAAGDGVTDDYAAITNAIANCPDGQAVYFPAGTYLTSKILLVTKPIVLRGAGPTSSMIVSSKASGSEPDAAIKFGVDNSSTATSVIQSGGDRGSQAITVASAAGMAVGQHVSVYELPHDTDLIFGSVSKATNYVLKWQWAKITNVAGAVVTIDRPLYWNYTNSAAYTASVKNRTAVVTNAGIENLTLKLTGSVTRGIYFYYASDCWATNCVVTNAYGKSYSIVDSGRITITGSAAYHPQSAGTSKYGVQIVRGTDCLIEDCIFDLCGTGILIQEGASGNVAAYNFVHRGQTSDALETSVKYGVLAHGDFTSFNLFEGNSVPRIGVDNFWGCNNRITLLRNWAKGYMLGTDGNHVPDNLFACNIDMTNYYANALGNVFGYPPHTNGITELALGWDESTGSMDSDPIDDQVEATAIIHGNYSAISKSTTWDGDIADHTLPDSYYLASKPAFFGTLTWPPFDGSTGATNMIPAEARWYGIDYSVTPPTISSITPSPGVTTCDVPITTDEAAYTGIEYGLTAGYGSSSTNANLLTTRTFTLSGLTASTEYHFSAYATDAYGNTTNTADATFTTAAGALPTPEPEKWRGGQFHGGSMR